MKTSEKLIQRIIEEPSRPAPKWVTLLKNKLILAAFILAILLGGAAVSVILFAVQQTDFRIISHMSHSSTEMFLGLLPFIWVILIIIALAISMYAIFYSRRGYKFTLARIFTNSAALSILIGTLFFIAGGAQALELVFATHLGNYESIQERKTELWSKPEEGFLSGEITEINATTLHLVDFNKKEWEINYKDAFVAPPVILDPGETIKLIGKMDRPDHFMAKELRPWGGRGSAKGRHGRND